MSIKLRAFASYVAEAFGMYFKNIHTIFGITLLINIAILYAPATAATYLLSILRPDYYTSEGITISISNAADVIFCLAAALLVFLIIIVYDSILSVYAFYITFKSDDENYTLFLSMIKSYLWNIVKTKFVAFSYILIGLILGIIPGIVLMLRYAAINYFAMVYGDKFTEAREKSAAVMHGFKLVFLAFSIACAAIFGYGINYTNAFIDQGAYSPILYALLALSLTTIFSTLNTSLAILTYNLCKHEGTQESPVENVTPEIVGDPVVMMDAPAEIIQPTTTEPAQPQTQQPVT